MFLVETCVECSIDTDGPAGRPDEWPAECLGVSWVRPDGQNGFGARSRGRRPAVQWYDWTAHRQQRLIGWAEETLISGLPKRETVFGYTARI